MRGCQEHAERSAMALTELLGCTLEGLGCLYPGKNNSIPERVWNPEIHNLLWERKVKGSGITLGTLPRAKPQEGAIMGHLKCHPSMLA